MEKRYQVFVSSTYADLQDERQEVMQALLELDCIPAGMELFPAANEDQWTLIKKVIDDSDYYMVIVAGRYGSIGPGGLSFTEMEYRYALETGKPVIGFIHSDPNLLQAGRCETTEQGKMRLKAFTEFVKQKMCRFWDNPSDLGSQVSRSLVKLIKNPPGIGWVRGDSVPDETTTQELLNLRRHVEELEAQIQATRTKGPEGTSGLAQGTDKFEIHFSFVASPDQWSHHGKGYRHSVLIEWNAIFSAVAPMMIDEAAEKNLADALEGLIREYAYSDLKALKELNKLNLMDFEIEANDFQTIKVQLRALGLITKSNKTRSVKDTRTYWTLTPYGDTVMTRLRAVRKDIGVSDVLQLAIPTSEVKQA